MDSWLFFLYIGGYIWYLYTVFMITVVEWDAERRKGHDLFGQAILGLIFWGIIAGFFAWYILIFFAIHYKRKNKTY